MPIASYQSISEAFPFFITRLSMACLPESLLVCWWWCVTPCYTQPVLVLTGLVFFVHILSFNPLSPLFWWCIEGISNLHKIQPLLNDGSRFESKRPCGSAGKESTWNEGDLGLIPGSGRSPGEGKGYPLQYSGLENSMDCIVHGVAKSWIRQQLSLHRVFLRASKNVLKLDNVDSDMIVWID